MPRKYQSAIIPHSVVNRMRPEDFASCFNLGIGADAVTFTPHGERPLPNALYLREPEADRTNAIWYYNEVVDGVATSMSTRCLADDKDGATAWVLTRMARLADKAMAKLAPESIPVCGLLVDYAVMAKNDVRRGAIKAKTGRNYRVQLRIGGACLRGKTLADLQARGALLIIEWCEANGFALNTAKEVANCVKRAVNTVMRQRNSAYRLDYHVGMKNPRLKKPFDPDEMHRIMDRVDNGTIYGPDLKPLTVLHDGRRATKRCTREQLLASVPFQTAVPFMVESGTRHEASLEVTLTDPDGAYIDLDLGVLHRRGEMTVDTANKRRGSCVLSSAYMAKLRPLAEAMLAKGIVHLVHDRHGNAVKSLSLKVWRQILKDAQVPYRVLHCLKDTAVQIARVEGVPLYVAAERFATTPDTLVAFYGADWDLAVQIDPAEAQGNRFKWLARHEAAKARRFIADSARAARTPVGDVPAKPRGGARAGGGKPKPASPAAPAGVIGGAQVVALDVVEDVERLTRASQPQSSSGIELAHNVRRLADRKPEGHKGNGNCR